MPEEIINITIEDSNEAVNITVDETTEQVNITISDGQVTNTSELINDGADGIHPFITLEDIPAGAVESVTGDLVDNTDPANPIINWPTLAEVLSEGNATDGNQINLNGTDAIVLDNASTLKKGTYDFGANGGISRICGVGYEDMWQSGFRHVFDSNGLIRHSTNCFNVVPDSSFDVTLRFKIDSFWTLDNGDTYKCTDATEGAAVWELVNIGIIPNLQEVTTAGNETTNSIIVTDNSENKITLQSNGINFNDLDDLGNTFLRFDQTSAVDQEVFVRGLGGTMALTSDIPDVSTLVPYTGASEDVNLGEFGLLTGNIEFDNTPTNTPTAAGSMYYNNTDGTVDLILKGGNVTLQIGQESVIRVVNKTATNITLLEANYQAVRVTGVQGQRMKVDLAQATTDPLSAETIGLVTETIANNQEGFVTTSGLVRGINTTGSLQSETWADGDILYLSPTVAGRITKVKPSAPNHLIIIGYVIHAHITQGSIFVKVDNGYELDELHNVLITSAANNQGLIYESSSDIWKNKTIDKTLVGLANVDNTSDANKPVSTAQSTAIDAKVADAITNGVTTIAPSQNAVFDALALKQSILSYTPYKNVQTSQTAITATVAETVVFSATIPAGSFNSTDIIKVLFGANKTTGLGTFILKLRINTTNTIVGAPTIATLNATATAQCDVMMRNFNLNGGNLHGLPFGSSAITDIVGSGGALGSTPLNPANTFYIFGTVQLANLLDSIVGNMLSINN